MKRGEQGLQGRLESAPAGRRNADISSLSGVEKKRGAMEEVLRVCRISDAANWRRSFATGFCQRRFPNLPYSRSPKSAGREAALEVGLETCAATVRRHDLTHNLSLSFVASCHR